MTLIRTLLLVCVTCVSVAAQPYTIILGRPTDVSMTASVRFSMDVAQCRLEYGTIPGAYSNATSALTYAKNTPQVVVMDGLSPNTRYFYRLAYTVTSGSATVYGPEHTFHTQRAPGSTFRFLVEADEHLYDKKGVRSMYQVTLANEAADSADLLLSLGDIFGDDHTPSTTTSADMDALHADYRSYLGAVCHSMPFFVCLGNHEGENGFYLKDSPPNNIAVYGTLWRKYYYPNPSPNAFYSGNTAEEGYGMGLPENYYAWTWGDALFVVLDVYRHCDVNEKPQNWDWTLGEAQYRWLSETLRSSTARYKFVFAHHTRGQGRGGVTTAKGAEWGGYDNKGAYRFDTYRPGWGLPIHQLMVNTGVNIFFQGHDHLYAVEQLDGLVYQETPMPSDSTYEIGMLANADAYTDVTRGGTGHLRVTVAPSGVSVDFVRAYLPADTLSGDRHNGEIAHSYTVQQRPTDVRVDAAVADRTFTASYISQQDRLSIVASRPATLPRTCSLVDMQGRVHAEQHIDVGNTVCTFDANTLTSGLYVVVMRNADGLVGTGSCMVLR
ncbi:MAG: metallophosphoesterase [Bacteroidetes bacterium]|nr:metallophosphoesterase [Bacteroidota bacterium]